MVKFLAVYFLDKTKIIFSQPFFSYSLVTSLKWLHFKNHQRKVIFRPKTKIYASSS